MAKPNWLNLQPNSGSGNGTIANSADAHTGRVARTGVVTVTGAGVAQPATYNVTQTPKAEFASFNNGSEMAVYSLLIFKTKSSYVQQSVLYL